jgi:hypothetical protein
MKEVGFGHKIWSKDMSITGRINPNYSKNSARVRASRHVCDA